MEGRVEGADVHRVGQGLACCGDRRERGGEVLLHTIVGGGHTWPGAEEVPGLGAVTREMDASEEMWRFFQRPSAKPEPGPG